MAMVRVQLRVGDNVYIVRVPQEDVEAVKALEAMLNGRKAYCSDALRGFEAIRYGRNWEVYRAIDHLAAKALEDGLCVPD